MLKFNQFLIEQKNTHMEHIEDLIFNEGVNGTRKAIFFLRDLRDTFAGHSTAPIKTSLKYDGAPAIFAGYDPSDGQFFVAKKGIFNKNPKIYKTKADVDADLSGDLREKFLVSLEEFSKLNIPKGVVYQGDLMFTSSDVKSETIHGEKYITFQPNTIVYTVPLKSRLAGKIKRAKVGVVWHTVYRGRDFESMSASFGENIVRTMKNVSSVWMDDATITDVSGIATFTKDETNQLTMILSQAGKIFNKIPADLLNSFSMNDDLLIRVKKFINDHVRENKIVEPRGSARRLFDYITSYYQNEIDKKKNPASKQQWANKHKDAIRIFQVHDAQDFERVFYLMNLLAEAKQFIIKKMSDINSLGTFLRTRNGFEVTQQEGLVVIDHMGRAVKLVDRLEFSRANFSPDIVKGWMK